MSRTKRTGKRIVAAALALVMVLTTFASSVTMAFASDSISFEVSMSFKPQTNSVEIGGTGTYNIIAQASASEHTEGYFLTIALPRDSVQYLSNISRIEAAEGWTGGAGTHYSVPSEDKEHKLYLFVPDDQSQKPYLYFTLEQGGTCRTPVSFKLPEGISSEYTIDMSESDLNATYNDAAHSAIIGNLPKEVGDMSFYTSFSWNDVQKSVDPQTVSATAEGKMSQDLRYEVSADRSRQSGYEYIGMFTKRITFTDTVTLPDCASFIDGAVTIAETKTGSWNILAGDTVIAEINQLATSNDINVTVIDASISADKKKLTFKYVQETTYTTENADQYTQEMPYPHFELYLKGAGVLMAQDDLVDTTEKIKNEVDFHALSWDESDEVVSSAEANVSLIEPTDDFSISKSASESRNEDGTMTVEYKITVKNTGATNLKNLTITDVIPENLEIIDKGDAALSDSTLTWTVDIDHGQSVTKTIKARTKAGLPDNTEITNTATATYGELNKQAKATITYTEPLPDLTISKTALNSNGVSINKDTEVYQTEEITYYVDIHYNGVANVQLTDFIDTLPPNFEYVSSKAWFTSNSSVYNIKLNYDKENHKLTLPEGESIPMSPDGRESIRVEVTGRVAADAPDGFVLTNEAAAKLNNGSEDKAIHSTKVRDRNPSFRLTKDAVKDVKGNIKLDKISGEIANAV